MNMWQYRIEPIKAFGKKDSNVATLETLGQEGWELVAVDNMMMFLKRPA